MTTKTKMKTKTTIKTKASPGVMRAAAKVAGDSDDGSDARPLTQAERQKKYRETHKAKKEAAKAPIVVHVTEGDAQAWGDVGGVIWDIVGPMARVGPLNDEQKLRFGRALAPLGQKYLPMLADWQYEVAAVLCIMALAKETKLPPPEKKGEEDTADNANAAGSGE